ncbi:hypothetical protein L1049_022626 [Liquidambar formosana]|uniref:RING-type domain-containing protein n=1 Tax=Liquidambar formosana TaxID=63359 RepID=A0AAP0WNZ8_LIQFO
MVDLHMVSIPGPGSSSSNFFPMLQGHFHHCSPMPNDRNRSVCGGRDARYANGDPNRCFHGSVSASKPLPYKNKARLSSMGSENITVTRIPNGRNTFRSQHGSKDRVRTSLNESSKVSPTIRATNSTFGNIRSGRAQWSQLAQSSKDPALPIRKSGIQTTLAPRQVWQRKTKAQPSIRPSKPSSKRTRPTYHIRWNDMSQGFDESCQTVGANCHLCNQDLATAPTDYGSEGYYEFELSNLPNVDVLPCGHSFHSECLQLNTPEDQSRDPLCAICAYGFF